MIFDQRYDIYRPTDTNLDNLWCVEAYENIVYNAGLISTIFDTYGKRISSGFRCPKVNKAVGGVRGSKHLVGLAIDLHLRDEFDLYITAIRILQNYFVAKVIIEPSWLHIEFHTRPTLLRKEGKIYVQESY